MMRLDLYLVTQCGVSSRQRAANLIKSGAVKVDGKTVFKPSADAQGRTVELTREDFRYVSRGGVKLEGALDAFGVSPEGLICLDLGASTGGFTDCLLQRGAKRVYALDVGHGQLHEKLKNDPRVFLKEDFNARDLRSDTLPERISLAVCDVSFISQKLIYQHLTEALIPRGLLISLIKPQFEAGRESIGKNGIVRDLTIHRRVITELRACAKREQLYMRAVRRSPIDGGDGNREYLALFVYDDTEDAPNTEKRTVTDTEIERAVCETL